MEVVKNNALDRIKYFFLGGNVANYFIGVILLMFGCTVILQNFDCLNFFRRSDGTDSWFAIYSALEHVKTFPDELIYQTLLIDQGVKFQYPPSSLLLFEIPHRITNLNYHVIANIYNLVSWASVLITIIYCSKILTLVHDKYELKTVKLKINPIVQICLIGAITLFFYPLSRSYELGQIQTLLTMLVTLVLYFYLDDKKIITGVFLGLICLVKPQLCLVFLWGIIRKEWKMFWGGAITAITVLLVSISLYGMANHLNYLTALSYLSKYGEGFYPNQSINGLMNRLLFNGNNLNWLKNSFAPYNSIVYFSTLFSSILLMIVGLCWNYKNYKSNVVGLPLIILCATMASPIAWEHHYGIILPIFVLMTPFVLYFYKDKKAKIVLFVIAFLVASQRFDLFNRLASSYFNFLQSYLFFSALVILGFLLSISKMISKSSVKNSLLHFITKNEYKFNFVNSTKEI